MHKHTYNVRIFYEDTDAGGVVYHANYLKYMERARTEALREIGFEQHELVESEQMLFAVTKVDINYRRPAKLDNMLSVVSELMYAKGAKMVFKQEVKLKDMLLVDAEITLACIHPLGKPKRIPKILIEKIMQENKS